MDNLKLAGVTVVCENASGKRRAIDLKTFRLLREAHAFARLRQRKSDGAVLRCWLKAEPDEVTTHITGTKETIEIGVCNWIHKANARLMGRLVSA